MSVYRMEITIHATVYVRADSALQARYAGKALEGDTFELPEGDYGAVVISGLDFGSDELPEVSLSPAMTFGVVGKGLEEVE